MRNARLDESQTGIKIARRNINNLRYADDTSLIAESEEELREKTMAPHSSILAWRVGRVAIYSLDALLSQFGASPLFHVQF